MVQPRKQMSVNKTVSLPLGQVVQVSEIADAEQTDFSTTVAKLIRLGLVYRKQMVEAAAIEEDEKVKAEAATGLHKLTGRAAT